MVRSEDVHGNDVKGKGVATMTGCWGPLATCFRAGPDPNLTYARGISPLEAALHPSGTNKGNSNRLGGTSASPDATKTGAASGAADPAPTVNEPTEAVKPPPLPTPQPMVVGARYKTLGWVTAGITLTAAAVTAACLLSPMVATALLSVIALLKIKVTLAALITRVIDHLVRATLITASVAIVTAVGTGLGMSFQRGFFGKCCPRRHAIAGSHDSNTPSVKNFSI